MKKENKKNIHIIKGIAKTYAKFVVAGLVLAVVCSLLFPPVIGVPLFRVGLFLCLISLIKRIWRPVFVLQSRWNIFFLGRLTGRKKEKQQKEN